MNKRNFSITELPKGRGFIARVYGVIGYADMKRFDRREDAEAYLVRALGLPAYRCLKGNLSLLNEASAA